MRRSDQDHAAYSRRNGFALVTCDRDFLDHKLGRFLRATRKALGLLKQTAKDVASGLRAEEMKK